MTIRVGFAAVDITPPVGVELAGFGPFLRRRATEILEPLCARSIAVEDGARRWVLVSCDLLGIDAGLDDRVRGEVAAASGWTTDEIVVHATHAHSGPATLPAFVGWGEPDGLYAAQLPSRLADACLLAIADLADAQLAVGHAPLAGFAYNRMRPSPGRTNAAAFEGRWQTSSPELIDDGLDLIRVDRHDRPEGFVVRYSCHPVICSESTTAVHGDYPAVAIRLVEARRPGSTGIFLQGALGDIDPTFSHASPAHSYDALRRYAALFSQAIESALVNAVPDASMDAATATTEFEERLPSPERSELEARWDAAQTHLAHEPIASPGPAAALAAAEASGLRSALDSLARGEQRTTTVRIRAMRLGSTRIAAANLELFHGVQRTIRDARSERTWVLSTTGPYIGYCPTLDGFEPDAPPYAAFHVPYFLGSAPFAPDVSERVAEAMLAALAAVDQHAGAFT